MCLSVFRNHLNECRAVNYYILINMNSQIWFNYVQKYKLINICFVARIASLIQHHAFRRTQKTENSLGSRPFRPRSAGTEKVLFPAEFYCLRMIFSHKFIQSQIQLPKQG